MSESPKLAPIVVPAYLLRRPLPRLPGDEIFEPLDSSPPATQLLPSLPQSTSRPASSVTKAESVDSLVKSQVAAALKSSMLFNIPKANYRGKVAPGCSLFLAPPPEVTDEFLDAQFNACQGLIGREFRVDKRGRVAFGFFRSPPLAIAAIAKLQISTPPLYAELGERTVPEGKEVAENSEPLLELGEPYHTLRVSHPDRSVSELKDIFSLAGGMEEFHVDSKGVAWIKFSNVKTAAAALEYFLMLKDDVWAEGSISYAKNLDSDDDDDMETAGDKRNRNEPSRERKNSREKLSRDQKRSRSRRRSASRTRGKRTPRARSPMQRGRSPRGTERRREDRNGNRRVWHSGQRREKSVERNARRNRSAEGGVKHVASKNNREERSASKSKRSRSRSSSRKKPGKGETGKKRNNESQSEEETENSDGEKRSTPKDPQADGEPAALSDGEVGSS